MKKIYSLFVFAIASLMLASCDDDYTEITNSIQVVKSETTIDATGGSANITLTGEGLTATSAADWLTATMNGNVLTATATANPTRESRASHIDVKAANGDTYLVSIVQTGGVLSLSTNNLTVGKSGGKGNIDILAAGPAVTVESSCDWITSTVNGNTIEVTIAPCTEKRRLGSLTIKSGGVEETVTIGQLDFAKQFPDNYIFVYFDDEELEWFYLDAPVSETGMTITPFKNQQSYVIPLTINKTAETIKTANCGTYLGEYQATPSVKFYCYLAWGYGNKWSTSYVTDAAVNGKLSVAKLKSGKTVTRIDWEGQYTLTDEPHDIENWFIWSMSEKEFNNDYSEGYLVKFSTPYLMSTDEATTNAKMKKMNDGVRELPNGQVAYPAKLKNILRPIPMN